MNAHFDQIPPRKKIYRKLSRTKRSEAVIQIIKKSLNKDER